MSMFCYQCEQTIGGKGCTSFGACGKSPQVSALQDLLVYVLKGIGFYGQLAIEQGIALDEKAKRFVMDAIFSTLTNVNFDDARFAAYIDEGGKLKEALKASLKQQPAIVPPAASYQVPATVEKMQADAKLVGVMSDSGLNEDVRSLQQLITYGLKGLGAYAHHAAVLGQSNDAVSHFFFKAFAALTDTSLGVPELLALAMELGQVNLRCMELLDGANTGTYGHPEPTEVLVTKVPGPFIVVSGHDLKDLKQLLEQTEGKGVNIYTHGEMLPAHAYPEFKKYKHLVGNLGGAWQDQQKEFNNLPGAVLMTTNCLMPPKDSYKDRIYTTSVVGFPGLTYVEEKNGQKDFTPVIEKALSLGGFTETEPQQKILVGFGHNATLSHAGAIIDAVKAGAVKHFFLIGGCDGAKPGRNYYTELAEKAPKDTIILTLACGKYRFNKLDFGTIGGLPRLLDVGQCNDAYSAIKIALALAEAFECSVNDLPLSLVLSWYEQKAVVILLTLLSLGIKNIRLGPTLPAFVSPNVLNVLVENFGVKPVTTADQDLKAILG